MATIVSGAGQPKEVGPVVFLPRALLYMAGAFVLLRFQVWVETKLHGRHHHPQHFCLVVGMVEDEAV